MRSPASGQLSVMAWVPALSCVAMFASAPMRRPPSARAARGAASSAAARKSLFTWTSGSSCDQTTAAAAWPLFRCSGGELEHALHRLQRAQAELLCERDLGGAVAHAEVELLQGVEAHVGADAAIA